MDTVLQNPANHFPSIQRTDLVNLSTEDRSTLLDALAIVNGDATRFTRKYQSYFNGQGRAFADISVRLKLWL